MKEDSSLARNSTALAISLTSPDMHTREEVSWTWISALVPS
jgi:hypothetical protein